MKLTTRQWAKKRCKECAHIADLRQSNECKKRKRSGIENMELAIKASAECWDCMYRDDCISVAEKDNRANKPLPCHGCQRYQRLPNAI